MTALLLLLEPVWVGLWFYAFAQWIEFTDRFRSFPVTLALFMAGLCAWLPIGLLGFFGLAAYSGVFGP